MNKQLLTYGLLLVATASIVGVASVTAASAETTNTTKLTHASHIRAARVDVRLNQAVRDGTITSGQQTAVKAELKTLHQERKAALSKSSTRAQRQAEHSKLKAELQSWAKANNFPLGKLLPKLAN